MPIPKSAESRQHARGLLTLPPAEVLETMAKDAPYLSNGRARLFIDRLDFKNAGRYRTYETRIELHLDGSPVNRFTISNRPCPSAWKTDKGMELLSFVNLSYGILESVAKEEEVKDDHSHAQNLCLGRRNDARMVEEWRRYW